MRKLLLKYETEIGVALVAMLILLMFAGLGIQQEKLDEAKVQRRIHAAVHEQIVSECYWCRLDVEHIGITENR